MRLRWVILIAVFTVPVLPNQNKSHPGQTKAPWRLSLEERVALRTNPALARQRARDTRHIATNETAATNESQEWVDQFDGKTHPELFLPHEVFDELISMAFLSSPHSRYVIRRGLAPEVRRHGLPDDFWEQLESISSTFTADSQSVKDLLEGDRQRHASDQVNPQAALAAGHASVCRSRAAALTAARQTFGPERFDRFLYEVIATNMFMASDRLVPAEVLRSGEDGCR
jgi:hypothetical protein